VRELKVWNRIKSEIRQRNPNMIINDPNSHQENSFALRWAKQMKVAAETNDAAAYRNSKASLDTLRRNQNG
jgi:c-di-GMP-binding flagellar brake protein YcgR